MSQCFYSCCMWTAIRWYSEGVWLVGWSGGEGVTNGHRVAGHAWGTTVCILAIHNGNAALFILYHYRCTRVMTYNHPPLPTPTTIHLNRMFRCHYKLCAGHIGSTSADGFTITLQSARCNDFVECCECVWQ